jgi:hypothetical protein
MIYKHLINGEFYRLEGEILIYVDWARVTKGTAKLLALKEEYKGMYSGDVSVPAGSVIYIENFTFQLKSSHLKQKIKQKSLFTSTKRFGLHLLDEKELTHLNSDDDIFERKP